MIRAVSARLRRWSSHSDKYVPEHSLRMTTSMVPTLVSKGRWRYPLRWAWRPGSCWPHWAPHTASASADNSALTTLWSRSRIKSGGRLGQSPTEQAIRVNNMRCGHRSASKCFESEVVSYFEGPHADRPHIQQQGRPPCDYTTTQDTT